MSFWRQLRAVLMLPVMATLAAPAAILWLGRRHGQARPGPWRDRVLLLGAGAALIIGGVSLVGLTVRQFGRQGQGTLAPWDPPRKLVVQGIYRHVRNPMISGVTAILLGEALLFGSLPLLGWALLFFVINAIYIPLHEEPRLERRFGKAYRRYKEQVPRWAPRSGAWGMKRDA